MRESTTRKRNLVTGAPVLLTKRSSGPTTYRSPHAVQSRQCHGPVWRGGRPLVLSSNNVAIGQVQAWRARFEDLALPKPTGGASWLACRRKTKSLLLTFESSRSRRRTRTEPGRVALLAASVTEVRYSSTLAGSGVRLCPHATRSHTPPVLLPKPTASRRDIDEETCHRGVLKSAKFRHLQGRRQRRVAAGQFQ